MKRRVVAPLFASAFAAVLLASMGSGVAPRASALDPGGSEARVDQRSLSVDSSRICFEQNMPGFPGPVGWNPKLVARLKVPGATLNDLVEVRIQAPGWNIDGTRQWYTDEDGVAIVTQYGGQYSTLIEAKRAGRVSVGTATITVRLLPEGAPMSIQVSRWAMTQPIGLVSVKMRRTGQVVAFTGRLVTDQGRPVTTGYVSIYEIRTGPASVSSFDPVETDSQGAFRISLTSPKEQGMVNAVRGDGFGKWCSTAWSPTFK